MFGAKHRRNAAELAAATLMVLVNMPACLLPRAHRHTQSQSLRRSNYNSAKYYIRLTSCAPAPLRLSRLLNWAKILLRYAPRFKFRCLFPPQVYNERHNNKHYGFNKCWCQRAAECSLLAQSALKCKLSLLRCVCESKILNVHELS